MPPGAALTFGSSFTTGGVVPPGARTGTIIGPDPGGVSLQNNAGPGVAYTQFGGFPAQTPKGRCPCEQRPLNLSEPLRDPAV